ncbi:SpoIID/LytB domain-containing protein [Modestobacter sp. SSW1-42]|uniref:SpoIID/LytB domain-containing protein n=1 Tax=Modestobacter sp. SSW1-42 TaxID=596372 RepID=UPI0039873E28
MTRGLQRAGVLATCLATAVVAGVVAPGASASAAEQLTLTGHGYGHGRGLGQYGSLGYAVDKGWSGGRILDHFYGGTVEGDLGATGMTVRLTAQDGASSVTVTSAAPYYVGESGNALLVGAGQAVTVSRANGAYTMAVRAGGCNAAVTSSGPLTAATPEVSPAGAVDPADARSVLTLCASDRGYRGKLRFTANGAAQVYLVNDLPTEDYLRGVVPRESPAAWADLGGGAGINALAAQAVAARSYALSENRYPYARTCDTESCQVYGGAAQGGRWLEDPRTDRAVAGTAGKVRLKNGAIVRTEFSSSTGGYTAGGLWPAVVDEGDARSPFHDWSVVVPDERVEAAWPAIGDFTRMQVTGRNGLGADGGRVTTVDVVGTAGTVATTGNAVRLALGLRSDWFTPVNASELWSQLRDTANAGPADHSVWFGGPDAVSLGCDLLASGRDRLVAYDRGTWYLRASLDGGPADKTFTYGAAGWTPVCGDWDGDGRDGIGVYDGNGTWYLRNSASAGPADAVVRYGWSGATPVVGDWDGNGSDTLGVWDRARGTWLLRQSNTPGSPDVQFQYGFGGAVPVAGDWSGDGRTDVGVVSGGTWYLRTSASAGPADRQFGYGLGTDAPLVGDWAGRGADGIGVSRPGSR